MALACPVCGYKGEFNTLMAIRLDGDASFDDIAVTVLKCPQCRFKCAAVIEESRRGALDSEARNHRVYELDRDDLDALTDLISNCPEPLNDQCACDVHKALGAHNERDQWKGLKGATYDNLIYSE